MQIKKKRTIIGVAAVAAAGLAFGLVAPSAFADPTHPNPGSESDEVALVGVGSNTIQDVFTALTHVVKDGSGNEVFASYDATGSAQITPRFEGHTFDRPNGSGPGTLALRSAVNQENTVPDNGGTVTLRSSDVQFARSSTTQTPNSTGRYSQIPVAIDGVTYATEGTGSQIPTDLEVGDDSGAPFTDPGAPGPLNLTNIFNGSGYLQDENTGLTYWSGAGASPDQTDFPKIDAFVPQSGSGTRNFWLGQLGLSNAVLGAGVLDTFGGNPVEENDGSAVATDPYGIEPFSIASDLAQGHASTLSSNYGISLTDRTHSVQLNDIDSVAPTSGGVLNASFPEIRPVFVEVEHAQLLINPLLSSVFHAHISGVSNTDIYNAENPVTHANTIADFGFASLGSGTTIGGVDWIPGATNDRFN
ncbi:MAG: hypothetical protein WDM88_10790 [Galbitalea sp.]